MNRRDVLKLSGAAVAVVALPLSAVEAAPLSLLAQYEEAERYAAFIQGCLAQIARAMSVPYELLAQEYADIGQGPRVSADMGADRFGLVKDEGQALGRQDRLRFVL